MVMLSRFAFIATVSAVLTSAAAQLRIVSPGGPDLWWVAKSQNVIAWTCGESQYPKYTILVANKDPKILVSPIAIVAISDNADCSKTISQDQANQAPGTGYTVQFANPFNSTEVYAESQEFEIKPAGSSFPAVSATPLFRPGSTPTGSGAQASATATGAKAGATGAAVGSNVPFAMGVAALAAILGIITT